MLSLRLHSLPTRLPLVQGLRSTSCMFWNANMSWWSSSSWKKNWLKASTVTGKTASITTFSNPGGGSNTSPPSDAAPLRAERSGVSGGCSSSSALAAAARSSLSMGRTLRLSALENICRNVRDSLRRMGKAPAPAAAAEDAGATMGGSASLPAAGLGAGGGRSLASDSLDTALARSSLARSRCLATAPMSHSESRRGRPFIPRLAMASLKMPVARASSHAAPLRMDRRSTSVV
jgi:hypothetical protein